MLRPSLFITSNAIGDAIFSTGLLHHIAKNEPDHPLFVACGTAPAPLFRYMPNVEKIFPFRKEKYKLHWLKLYGRALPHRYHRIIDLRDSVLSRVLVARHKHILKPDMEKNRVAHIGALFHLDPPPAPYISIPAEIEGVVEKRLPKNVPLLAIGPTANWGNKIWAYTNYVELCLALVKERGLLHGASILIHAGPKERAAVGRIKKAFIERGFAKNRLIDFTACPLLEAAASLKHAKLYIGNDSGLTHLAAAVGAPSLALFGPTDDRLYAPFGEHCAIVRSVPLAEIIARNGGKLHDMSDITVPQVYEAACKLLEGKS